MIFGCDVGDATINSRMTFFYMRDGRVLIGRDGESAEEAIERAEEWPHREWLPAVILS